MLPAFASVPLPDITRRDVQDWVNALAASGLAPAAVRHAYRAVFQVGAERRDRRRAAGPLAVLPHRTPAAAVPVIEPLTPPQILTLATMIDSRYRAMVWLGAGCGLCWSEAAGLTRDRIRLGARAQGHHRPPCSWRRRSSLSGRLRGLAGVWLRAEHSCSRRVPGGSFSAAARSALLKADHAGEDRG